MTDLPDVVGATCARYLELIDKALPGQVLGLYLTGSVPQGDFHPGVSDIDGVVVVATPLESAEPVRAVHEALPEKPAGGR
jgi:nucleotidyltransferase-like protein